MKIIRLAIAALILFSSAHAQTTLLPFGSSWKYFDKGTNLSTAWRGSAFNDATWLSGNAQLGYGDGDEATIVSFGGNASKKYMTTYFRKTISILNPAQFSAFTLGIKRDDGAVVYINGVEVFRSNMPTGTISFTTKASTAAADDGATVQSTAIAVSRFSAGNNTIAVEMHQNAANSTDLSFDLQLTGTPIATNIAPVANAGADVVLTSPTSSTELNGTLSSDADGNIVSYAWSQISGPSASNIGLANTATPIVSALIQGVYTFRLQVTDNGGATATDDVVVSVNGSPVEAPVSMVVDFNSNWKYLDNGIDQGIAWRQPGFNDASWLTGNGQLGFGDGDEATVLQYGADVNNKYITSYFRKAVDITNPSAFTGFTLNLKRDDGVVVYVNGVEVYRNNMPTGTIGFATLASTAAADDGNTTQTTNLAISNFVAGPNMIAVEMHQNAGSSSDLSFDLQLLGGISGGATITRGPYLQMANQTATTLRWRTDVATNSKIEVGTVLGTFIQSANNGLVSTEHEVRITGLLPDTKYFYRFGSSTQWLQGGAENNFTTAPAANTTRKIKVAVYGDCGRNDAGFQPGTLNSYRRYTGNSPAELMLLLGDNAYNSGTDAEFQSNFFNAYSSNILKNHVLFPAPGNHDYANDVNRQVDHNVPYFNIFTVPANAESGGVASTTKAFYSYNWGNIHFLSLDSYGFESPNNTRLYDTLGTQVTWLKADLAANTSKWTVAYWHHPPYTMGSHNSDTETELVKMRQNFIRILERYGVDLVLCGHSHDYERSYLLKDYFGNEASFNATTHAVSTSSAFYDDNTTCPYTTVSGQINHGTVYVVAGSAGADGTVQAGYPHNALPFSQDDGGMLYFEVEDNRLDAKFLRRDGVVADKFTIVKDVKRNITLSVPSGQTTTLTAGWPGVYNWSNGGVARSITINPSSNATYICNDAFSCLADTFNINIISPVVQTVSATALKANISKGFKVYPSPVKRGTDIVVSASNESIFSVQLLNENGKQISNYSARSTQRISTINLPGGIYFIRTVSNGKISTRKVVVTE